MNKYQTLIIGCGGQGSEADQPGRGKEHKIISFSHAFKEHNGFSKTIFWDKSREKREKAARIWDGYTAINFETIFLVNKIDVAVVTTPDDTHYDILKQLAKYSLKLVICEKPICTDLHQAKEIVELYKAKNIPILVNYTRRFLPCYDQLKQLSPINGSCSFNRGWFHTATHAIDFFNMIGLTDYWITEVPLKYRVWELHVDFGHGLTFTEERIGDMPVWNYYDKSHWHVIENAYNFLEGKEPLKCTGEDGLKALEICFELMNK